VAEAPAVPRDVPLPSDLSVVPIPLLPETASGPNCELGSGR